MIKSANHGIEAHRRQGGHVQGAAHLGAAAPDAPFAAPGAAIPVKGRHPHQGGDLPAVKVPQFREPGHYAQGGLGTHPGDTAQELVLIQPDGITPEEAVDIPVQLPQLLFQGLQGRLSA